MQTITRVAASLLLIATAQAVAQQPAATTVPSGQAAVQVRAEDPRSMGGGDCRDNPYNCRDVVNPLPATDTVWLEEMTWIDVRDALAAGKTSILIPTGGIEPNGPWLVTGKHNYVLHANCEAIARKLSNALCAPIIKLVPEGDIEPKTSHMLSPGTISMREDTFRAVLRDTAESLQAHGFKYVMFIGDSGGNQAGQQAVADELTAKWGGKALALHISEYYDRDNVTGTYMHNRGIPAGKPDMLHDDPIITLNMFIDDPDSVRYDARVKAGKASIDGHSIADRAKATALARQIVEYRTSVTVDAINRAIASKGRARQP